MNQAVIDIQGITKTYVNGKLSVPVLHGIDLQVNKGEFVSIIGLCTKQTNRLCIPKF